MCDFDESITANSARKKRAAEALFLADERQSGGGTRLGEAVSVSGSAHRPPKQLVAVGNICGRRAHTPGFRAVVASLVGPTAFGAQR